MSRKISLPTAFFRFTFAEEMRAIEVRGHTSKLLGFRRGEILSSSVSLLDRIHPEDADLKAQIFSASEPRSGRVCLRVRHADGRIRCLEADFDKGVDRTVTVVLRHPPQDSRRRENIPSTLGALLEKTEEGVFFKDRNHVFTAASDSLRTAMASILEGRELVGSTDYDLLAEQDADGYYRGEKQVLATGTARHEVFEVTRPDRRATWIHASVYPVRDASGEIAGIFAIVRNLTARITTEERQPPARDPVTGKIKPPEMGTYVLDVRRGIFTASANLDGILGVDIGYPHDLGGWDRLIYPADRSAVKDYLQEVLSVPGRIFNWEYRIVRVNDGEVRWIHGIGRVDRDREGNALIMRGTVQDITSRKQTEAALLETKNRLQLFIEHAPAALAMFDREMRYLAVSRRWKETYGVTAGDIVGLRHYDVVKDLPEHWKEAHKRVLAGESLRCDEDRFERADGTVLWVRWELMPWRAEDGSVGGIILFLEDITQAHQAEERLRLAGTLFEQASEAFVVTDLNGSILRVNDAFTRMTGYPPEEVLGSHIELLKSDRHDESFYAIISRDVVEQGRWRGELWNRARDGHDIPVAATVTTVFNAHGDPQYYVSMFFDISSIKEQERQLQHVVHFDALTGLPNRVSIAERLRDAMQDVRGSGRMLAVVQFDLDDFKKVNDRFGKLGSDSLLLNVASRMKQVLREGDMLGRPGGDEFVAILSQLSGAGAAAPAMERLLQAAAEPQLIGGLTLRVSATAGVTFYPQQEEVDADQLLRQADQAMYEAKLAGKNRYHVFDPVRDYSRRGRLGKLQEIERALASGEFVLHYQPKINMATGTLIGAEALIRWRHPERGLLSPGAFLPLIEEHDLAVSLGEWVIDNALAQMVRWADSGHRIGVSINLSARHLQQPDFIERLRAILANHPRADTTCLELEVLETSTLEDVEHVSQVIEACSGIGITVAIDDFGTGYSSLTYLKRLPATVLKIDQSFVRDMLDDPDDLAILQGVMGLANAFHRIAIAEGVENVEQGSMLLRLGCHFAQGNGIAEPMPAEDLPRWAAEWRPDSRWRHTATASPLDWPALLAEVGLRAWSRALEEFIADERSVPPELDEHESRFGAWIRAEKIGPRAGSASIAAIESLHAQVHRAARNAVELKRAGADIDAAIWLRRSQELRGEIHAQLDALLAGSAHFAPILEAAPGQEEYSI